MTLPSLRDLEQRWRDKATLMRELRQYAAARVVVDYADELAAVRLALEASLEQIPRYPLVDLPDHKFIYEADLAACLVGAKEPR